MKNDIIIDVSDLTAFIMINIYGKVNKRGGLCMLKGIAASAGISIARVYKLEAPKVEIVKKEGDPAAEVEKFNAARRRISKG